MGVTRIQQFEFCNGSESKVAPIQNVISIVYPECTMILSRISRMVSIEYSFFNKISQYHNGKPSNIRGNVFISQGIGNAQLTSMDLFHIHRKTSYGVSVILSSSIIGIRMTRLIMKVTEPSSDSFYLKLRTHKINAYLKI